MIEVTYNVASFSPDNIEDNTIYHYSAIAEHYYYKTEGILYNLSIYKVGRPTLYIYHLIDWKDLNVKRWDWKYVCAIGDEVFLYHSRYFHEILMETYL